MGRDSVDAYYRLCLSSKLYLCMQSILIYVGEFVNFDGYGVSVFKLSFRTAASYYIKTRYAMRNAGNKSTQR